MKVRVASRMAKVSYAIRDIVAKAEEAKKKGKRITYLNIGDPNKYGFAPPKHVTAAIIEALHHPEKYSGYAPSKGDPELVAAVAKREGVTEDNVFITAGLSEGISFLLSALVESGDNVLLPSPGYPLYQSELMVNSGVMNEYECLPDWQPDVDDMRRKINERTQAIVVINPNNPTGAVYGRKTLEQIVDLAGEFKVPIISDEIYDRMVYGETPMLHLADIAKDVPVITGNGISKVYLYPGARVGYLAFHGGAELGDLRESVQKLANIRLSINWEMQRGALAAFTGSHGFLTPIIEEFKDRADFLTKRVNEIEGLQLVRPQAAFYAYVKINDPHWKTDTEFVYRLLEEKGILTVPGSGFSFSRHKGKFFRMVFLPPKETLSEACDKIERFMKAARHQGSAPQKMEAVSKT